MASDINWDIAKVCHQANKAWCEVNGDCSQKDWEAAEQWQRNSAVAGVRFALANPTAPDSAQHDAWMNEKLREGWKHGPVKDAQAKTHPCLVPFEQLPRHQQLKDELFRAIVQALAPAAQPVPISEGRRRVEEMYVGQK